MTPDNKQIEQHDEMMDTQQLLGMEPPAEGTFALEDILAEFGVSAAPKAKAVTPPPQEMTEPVPEEATAAVTEEPESAAVEPAAESVEAELPPPQPPPVPEPKKKRRIWWFRKAKAASEDVQQSAAPEAPELQKIPEIPEIPAENAEDGIQQEASAGAQNDEEVQVDEAFLAELGLSVPIKSGAVKPEAPAVKPEAETPESVESPEAAPVEETAEETVPETAPETAPAESTAAVPAAEETAEAPDEPPEPAAEPVQTPAPEPEPEPENGTHHAPSPPNSRAGGIDPAIEPVPMEAIESIMANTVDAVKEEQEIKQERLRKRLEKARKAVSRSLKKGNRVTRHPLPDTDNEPNPAEPAAWNKRRWQDSRKYLLPAVFVTALLWLPWVLTQFFGITVPFFSESTDNASLCVLVPEAALSVLCWPVFRAALESLKEGAWSIYATAALCTVVTLLDEMTLLLLPKRVDAAPLGGVAAVLLVFSLWGLTSMYRGMSESLRTVAIGEPSRLADRCNGTIAKAKGRRKGFYTRITMEDTPAQWQRLLLPVLAAASLVFAVLSSVGKEEPQNLLWCWSVVLCASSSLVFPLAYSVPFGRLAAKLARSGAAVAGQYGASILASSRKLAVTDEDLFPQNTSVGLGNVKPYGEERNRAISYAATLLVQGGGVLGRLFQESCRTEHISLQSIEHFHIHDDNGLSGMIHGETVLVGTTAFMRHKGVKLPESVPAKTSVCLAVDGALAAVFNIRYTANDTVEYALRAIRKNGMQITLASRDGNVNPRLLKERFGTGGNILYPEMGERLTLSDPEREADGPNGVLYRDGVLPFAALAIGSTRLCQTVLIGDVLAILSSIAGSLLGFYLTFTGSCEVLTPTLLLTYAVLWVLPVLPMIWTVDKL